MQEIVSKEVIEYFIDKDILISADLINSLNSINKTQVYYSLLKKTKTDFLAVLNKELLDNLSKNKSININWVVFDSAKTMKEKDKDHE